MMKENKKDRCSFRNGFETDANDTMARLSEAAHENTKTPTTL
jgi:hypothetical protein